MLTSSWCGLPRSVVQPSHAVLSIAILKRKSELLINAKCLQSHLSTSYLGAAIRRT